MCHIRPPGLVYFYDRPKGRNVTLVEQERLAERFEKLRPRLRAIAYRMLGSLSEADDAVQEGWLRLSRSDARDIANLAAWLTTVVVRVCLNMLQSRSSRREEPLEVHLPEPIVTSENGSDPEAEALLAEAVGLAMQVVLETLSPAERVAFVLHDIFSVPFEEIASMVGRSPAAVRQLASRARREVQGRPALPDASLDQQWKVVDAFFAAARNGDLERLVAVLDPEVVLREDRGRTAVSQSRLVRGAHSVARSAIFGAQPGRQVRRALVNGGAGAVIVEDGRPVLVMSFLVRDGRIHEIDLLADPERVSRLKLPTLA